MGSVADELDTSRTPAPPTPTVIHEGMPTQLPDIDPAETA